MNYPKRLIEVDLPIKRISAHARREKSIRHGHISTLHIWWARRPLAACRAVICAALWPDPADPLCPPAFRVAAARIITDFAVMAASEKALSASCAPETWSKWCALAKPENRLDIESEAHLNTLRFLLLDFIADFANWDNSTGKAYLDTSRALTQAAHEALGGEVGTRPLVIDPFAGGGSIPLEALRVGADAFASDLNPIPVLLNKVVLEYIPKYGQRLADEVRKWGEWIKQEAEKELAEFYPKDSDGATPIAYLWARTIRCEGPGCGAEVPLMRSLWLAKKGSRSIAVRLVPRSAEKRVDFDIIFKQGREWSVQGSTQLKIANPTFDGTVKRGSATCPCCGYTTPVARVREQMKEKHGGTDDARLYCVVSIRPGEHGRSYRLPNESDLLAVKNTLTELKLRKKAHAGSLSLVPDEVISLNELRRISVPIYGMTSWGNLFLARQSLAMTTVSRLISELPISGDLDVPVKTMLALALDKQADLGNSLTRWKQDAECPVNLFGRQAIPMVWDFAETAFLSESSGSWQSMFERTVHTLEQVLFDQPWTGHISLSSATSHPLPDDAAEAIISDPPYYDAVPYAYLSDFFYVWLRRSLAAVHPDLFRTEEVSKAEEIVVDRPHELSNSTKDIAFYERELTRAFADARRVVRPSGIGTIVFASKTTSSWEAILQAVVEAGWVVTGSWPIDTEMEARVAAQGQARLASSVHLVCRPRENPDGSMRMDEIGDWRDVLLELPKRIHEWMPRLADEGVVGADAIFACLGPALEIFSRYSRVEKASGEVVPLKEYLEHVWAVVAKEALNMIFAGADTSGFEEDARLTAMWLWTLSTAQEKDDADTSVGQRDLESSDEDDEESGTTKKAAGGFSLEFDAARKIAQGLGAHLEKLRTLVEVKGENARLLPVGERALYLFGKDAGQTPQKTKKKEKQQQLNFFDVIGMDEEVAGEWGVKVAEKIGATVLDRLHQSMILFAAGRSEALKRFLVEDGVGRDQHFWVLAQALSALYPSNTEEKRWVDGVLSRKKGLGF